MRSSRFRPEVYRVLIHPLMSIAVASTGVLATVWMVGANLGFAAPRAATIGFVVLATVVEAVVGNILYRERAGIGSRVRELLIYLGALYLWFSVTRSGPFGDRFSPSFDQMLPIAAVAAAWLIAFILHNRLRGRESLLRAFSGKHGEALRHAVLERQRDMADTVRQLRRGRGLIGGLFAVLTAFAIAGTLDVVGISVLRPGSGAFVLLVLYGITGVTVIGTLNTFIQEYEANGEGLAIPMRFRRRRSIAVAALVLLVLVLSFALSRAQSILPLDAIGDFFRWLGDLFARDGGTVEWPRFRSAPPRGLPPELLHLMQTLEPREPQLLLRVLARLVEQLAITVLIIGGAFLLFGPIFSPAFRQALRSLEPRAFLAGLRNDFLRRMRILVRFFRHGFRRRRLPGEPGDETKAARPEDAWRDAAWKPGLRKRRQMDRVVQVFVDITQWGRRHGIGYARSEAAREYLLRIAALRPERYVDAVTVAETFCEARFSRHLVSGEQLRQFVHAAKRITASD